MQRRHRQPAAGHQPRPARGLAVVAFTLLLLLLTAPAALAAPSQPETVPGGSSGTRLEFLAIGLGLGGILLVGGLVLVLINRPQRSRADATEDEDEPFPEDGTYPQGTDPGETYADGAYPDDAYADAQYADEADADGTYADDAYPEGEAVMEDALPDGTPVEDGPAYAEVPGEQATYGETLPADDDPVPADADGSGADLPAAEADTPRAAEGDR